VRIEHAEVYLSGRQGLVEKTVRRDAEPVPPVAIRGCSQFRADQVLFELVLQSTSVVGVTKMDEVPGLATVLFDNAFIQPEEINQVASAGNRAAQLS
jgi:hypothetical protein